jgi:GTP-binding protein HflX
VRQVLGELGVAGRPTLVALNKIDLLDDDVDPAALAADLALPADVVPISGEARLGLDALLGRIEAMLEGDLVPVTARIPYARSDLVEIFHREGQVTSADFTEDGTTICGQLPLRLVARFRPFLADGRAPARRRAHKGAAPAVATP